MSQKVLDELHKIREEQARKFGKTLKTITLQVDQLIAIQLCLQNREKSSIHPPDEFDRVCESTLAAVQVALGKME